MIKHLNKIDIDAEFIKSPFEAVIAENLMLIWLMASLILFSLLPGMCLGANPCGITVSPASGLTTSEYGGTATFTVVLNCEPVAGTTVTVNLSSSDTSEGTVSPSSLTFTAANSNTPQTVTVTGVDDAVYDGNQGFQIITSPAASSDPKFSGVDASDVYVTNTDNDNYTAPEINLMSMNGVSITDGDTAPSIHKDTDFKSSDISSGLTGHTFIIENKGNATLNLGGNNPVSITGTNAADFSVMVQPAPSIAPGSYTHFLVGFKPSATGIRSALISIANDDSDENPYNFALQGTGTSAPLMSVEGNSRTISNGTTSTSDSNSTYFGAIAVTGEIVQKTFTIRNTGSADLNLTGTPRVEISGPNASEFTVSSQPSSPISAGGGSITFTVTFDPKDAGVKAATVSIANDSANASPYTFAISGIGKHGIIVSPASGLETIDGGGTATFNVYLDRKPTADVKIELESSDSSRGLFSIRDPKTGGIITWERRTILTFTAYNWNEPQPVTIMGNYGGAGEYKIITRAAQSEDPKYNGMDPADVSVRNSNRSSGPGIVISPGEEVTVAEGVALPNLTNNGSVDGGILSGTITNNGTLSNATLAEGSTIVNTGGTISNALVHGSVYGGTISGTTVLSSSGVLSGLTPEGSLSYLIMGTGSNVSGGLISGGSVTILGHLSNSTLGAGTSLGFTDGSEAVGGPGGLGGTITFMVPSPAQGPGGGAGPGPGGEGGAGPGGDPGSAVGCTAAIPQGTSYPEATSVPPQGFEISAVGLPAYATGHDWSVAGGRTLKKAGKSEAFIPEIPGGYALVGGVVLSETGARSSSDVGVSIPYDKSKIPNGYGDNDITALVYDYNDKAWIKAPSSRSGDSAIKLNTDLISAYALVVKLKTPPASDLISVSQISGNTSEDGSIATFTVVLGSAPSSDVTIGITSSDSTEGIVSPSSLIFTPENWNIAQAVSVIGADDYEIDGDQPYFIVTGASVSNDPSYNGIDPSDVSVVNTDNDKGVFIPAQISPENGAADVSMSPVLSMQEPAGTISGFGKHSKTRWQVSRSSDFAPFDLVFSITASTSLYSVTVPYLALTPGATYFWRARFIDDQANESDWSHAYRFTVIPVNPDDKDGDGIADSLKISTSTDLDADGTDDANQTDMLRTKTASGDVMIGVKKTGSVLSIGSAMAGPEKSAKAGERPLGVLEIKASVSAPGAEAEILIHSSTALGRSSGWLAYDASSGWYDYSSNTFLSSDGKCVTLKLKDGGYGDEDGCANGKIVHKAALPKTAADEADSGGSCFIDSVNESRNSLFSWIVTALAAFLITIMWKRKKCRSD